MIRIKSGTYSNEFKEINVGGELRLRKQTSITQDDLIKEINFLINIPDDLKKHFPTILNYSLNDELVYYDMPLYEYPTLRSLLIDGLIEVDEVILILKEIISFMFDSVYTININHAVPKIFEEMHLNRINDRLPKVSASSEFLRSVIDAEVVIINGETVPSIKSMLHYIQNTPELLEKIIPNNTSMVHGDFHFDNILINPDTYDFILIDPRGELRGYDWAYDIGKLWTSFDGKYDLIHEGLIEVDYDFDGAVPVVYFEFTDNVLLNEYNEINVKMEKIFNFFANKEDISDYSLYKVKMIEALHFCALAPFHLTEEDIDIKALTRYATGIQLLNRLILEYREKGEVVFRNE